MIDDATEIMTLSELASIAAGYPLRASADSLDEGDTSFIQIRNIALGTGVEWNEVVKIALPAQKYSNWLIDGDIVFTARGSKNYAIALDGVPNKAVCAPQFFVLRVKDKRVISPDFLAWQINQKPAQNYFKRSAVGSHLLNIRRPALENLKIAPPPLRTQKLIVNMWKAGVEEEQAMEQLIQTRHQQIEAIALGLFKNNGDQAYG